MSDNDPDNTGWTVIAKNNSVVDIVDTLLDMPPHREFNQTELSEYAPVSRKSVNRHIDFLLELEVVEKVPKSSPQRYRFNPESNVSKALIELDGAVNNKGPYARKE